MKKATFTILAAFVIISGAASWTIERRANVSLAEARAKVHSHMEDFARRQAEAEQLSNALNQATAAPKLSTAEFNELLRLRGRVGLLRTQCAEAAELQVSNQMLAGSFTERHPELSESVHWTRDQLRNAGQGDPESAIITTFWALSRPNTIEQVSTPASDAQPGADGEASQLVSADLTKYYQKLGDLLNPSGATAIHIVKKQTPSPDEAILDLYYEGEGKTRRFKMMRVNGGWELADLISTTAH